MVFLDVPVCASECFCVHCAKVRADSRPRIPFLPRFFAAGCSAQLSNRVSSRGTPRSSRNSILRRSMLEIACRPTRRVRLSFVFPREDSLGTRLNTLPRSGNTFNQGKSPQRLVLLSVNRGGEARRGETRDDPRCLRISVSCLCY